MTHADEARRIAPPESYGTLCNEIAAALAAAERRGIERLRPALERFDIDYYCEEGPPESEACRYAPSVLADAIRALLPAELEPVSNAYKLPSEPAAKCCCGNPNTPGVVHRERVPCYYKDAEPAAKCVPDDVARCPRCGWPLAHDKSNGCVPGNCSYRPDPDRAPDEYARVHEWDLAHPWTPAAKCATCGGTGRVLDKVVASHVSGRGHENSVIYKPCPSCSAKDGGS